jgi:signal transduction histidine kinase/AmiR/NasT family two-component response regulator/HPt (histidine-containing phosphotransfer) domain-containing protein
VRTIRAKLAILVMTAVVSAVLMVSLTSAWKNATLRFSAKRLELQGVAAAIATAVAHPLASGDTENVARTLSAVGRIPGLTFARVTDAKGRQVQQFGFGVVVAREQGPAEANAEIGPLNAFYLATYPVMVPVISSGVEIGRLTLIADLSPLRGAVIESLVSALLAGAAAIVAGLLLSQRLYRGITIPMANLTLAMEEVSKTKDFTRQATKTSHDEIGRLVDAFNAMLNEIQTRDSSLARHRDHLDSEVKDRTIELVGAKQAAEAASAAKSEFLATMSHEIRTPMNGMLVMAELIASGSLTPRLQRYANVLVNSGHTLLAIINDILDFSKIEAGKLELECIPVAPRQVIDDTLRLFNERAVSQGLDLAVYVAPDVPLSVAADPVRLTQVLSNLINNALKFTKNGSVSVHATMLREMPDLQPWIKIDVIDTGIGIPPEKLATIFDAFSQADQSTTRQFGGTGIGLTICRRLVTAMDGEITVSSDPGAGSTFSVRVPAAVLEASSAPVKLAGRGDKRVVIAMNCIATRNILTRMALERGLEPVAGGPQLLANTAWQGTRAILAHASDISRHSESLKANRSDTMRPVTIALSRIGEALGDALLAAGSADIVLEQPLSCVELGACFDNIVLGRSSIRASRNDAAVGETILAGALPFAGLRALAADDNAVNREVLSEALARLGVHVVCVENGLAAFEAVQSSGFDIVLMDCSMPVMDGFEATRCIRAWESTAQNAPMPIVALTAYVVGEAANACREAGMSGYLTKPYTLKALRECLERSVKADWRSEGRMPDQACVTLPLLDAGAVAGCAEFGVEIGSDQLLDLEVMDSIRELQEPGDDLVDRIVHLYAQHAPKALETILALEQSDEAKKIAAAAHALRSLSRNMGANQVANLCTTLEVAARSGNLSGVPGYCRAIALALPATIAALTQQLRPDNAISDQDRATA